MNRRFQIEAGLRAAIPPLWPAPPPLHQLFLIAMGTPLLDNLSLEAVAEEAARQNRWEFLLTAGPLAVAGGTGSPMNPVATC